MRPTRPRTRSGPPLAFALGCLLPVLTAHLARAEDQAPRAKVAGKTAPLARYVPSEDLVAFFEFDGLDAHAARWRQSAAYKVLTETKTGALIADLLGQGLQAAVDAAPGGRMPTGAQLARVLEAIPRDGFVVGVAGRPPAEPHLVLAVRGGAQGEVREALDLLVKGKPRQKAGRAVSTLGGKGDAATVCWFEGNDLVVTTERDVERIAAVIDGKSPSALTHPIRAELVRPDKDFEAVARGFLDVGALPKMPPRAVAAGLDGLKRVELRWGFQDDALLTVLDVVAPAPRRGLLTLLDQPTFDKGSLPPLPAGLTGFTVGSIDLAKTFDAVDADLKKAGGPGAAPGGGAADLARKVRRDLLPHLGPKVAFYSTPDPNAAANPMLAMMAPFNGLTLTFQTDDPAALGKALGPLIDQANQALKAPRKPPRPDGPTPEVRKTGDTPLRYEVDLPPGSVPPGPLASLRPTLIVGETQVVLAAQPRPAESAVALAGTGGTPDARWRPTGAFEPMARRLPANLILLNVSDPRTSLPAIVASLPALVPFLNATIARAAQQRPQAGAPNRPFALKIDPEQVPTAAELTERLFPASFAVSVDRRGLRAVSREPVPSLTSPATAGVMVGLLLPAVQAAREAARRAQCVNNEKQIALAMLNYHAANDSLPPAAVKDKAGKPLLSWRVAILPYIEQQALYKEFHLDEPWDGPHNKALIASMPPIYACPSRPATAGAPGMTSYRVFAGKATAFPPGRAVKFADVTDGISQTLMVVETRDGVPWTKPEDLEFAADADPPKGPFFGAGSFHTGGFAAAMLDGSVRFLKNSIRPETFRALITRDGGEVIDASAY